MEPVVVDFAGAEAAGSAPASWRELPFGIQIKLRPETGLLGAAVQAQLAADLSGFHEGRDVLSRYGFMPEESGYLSDDTVATGFAVIVSAALRAAVLIEEWNLVDPDGASIEITPEACATLFNHGIGPGSGSLLLSSFNRLADEPLRRRTAEGNASGSSSNGASGEEPTTAGAVEPKASPAHSAEPAAAPAAPRVRTPRKPPKG